MNNPEASNSRVLYEVTFKHRNNPSVDVVVDLYADNRDDAIKFVRHHYRSIWNDLVTARRIKHTLEMRRSA